MRKLPQQRQPSRAISRLIGSKKLFVYSIHLDGSWFLKMRFLTNQFFSKRKIDCRVNQNIKNGSIEKVQVNTLCRPKYI